VASRSVGSGAAIDGALGERVRAARKALGMSQAQLAGEELTKGFISQLESGQVRPSIRSLQVIASRLGKPLEYFLGDEPLAAAKRVAFHRLAAETAAEQHDWGATREHVDRGLEQAADALERARFLQLRAQTELAAGAHERAFDVIAQALSGLDVAADPQLVASLLYLRGAAYGEVGQVTAATESLEAARDVIERYEVIDPRLRSRVLIALGTAYRRLRRSSKAITSYESALAAASRSSELSLAARGYMGIAAAHYDSGELDAAISSYQRALELFRRVSDIDFELNALQSIAAVQLENGQVEHARLSAQRAMARALEVGSERWAAVAEAILARVALKQGDAEASLKAARHAEKTLARSDDRIQHADAVGAVGAALEALGRSSDADSAYRRSIEMYTAVGDLADRSGMAAEYARVLKARGDMNAAFDMLELARGALAGR